MRTNLASAPSSPSPSRLLWATLLCALWVLASCTVGEKNGGEPGKDGLDGTPTGPVTVVLWHSYREAEQVALNQVVDQFNATHADIKLETLQIPHEAYADKITTAIPHDNGPDIFIFAHDRIGAWAEADIIESVSSWATTEHLRSYERSTVLALVYKKALYGLPLAFKSVVLFYNKDLVPTPPETDEDMIAIAKANTDIADRRYGLVYENTQLYFTAPFLHGFGGAVMNMDGDVQLDSPESAAGLQFCRDLLTKHQVVPADVNSNLVTTLFNSGKAAMVINGPWFRGEISDGVRWGVAPLPVVKSTGMALAPYLGSEAVLLSKRSPHKAQAYEVMQYLAGDESAKIRMTVGGQSVAYKAAWEEVEVAEDMRVFRKQLDHVVVMPNSARMNAVWGPTNQAIHKVVKDGEAPRKVVAEANARIEASLE